VSGALRSLHVFVQHHLSALSELTEELGEQLLTSALAGETSVDSQLIALLTTGALTMNNSVESTNKLTGERLECLLGSRRQLQQLETQSGFDGLDERRKALDSLLLALKLYADDLRNLKHFYQYVSRKYFCKNNIMIVGFSENLALVNIYFRDTAVKETVQERAYDFFSFLCSEIS